FVNNNGRFILSDLKESDYTFSGVVEIPEAGESFEVTITGTGVNCIGETKGTVYVPNLDILFNGSAQSAEPYIDKVTLSAEGYNLSLDPNGVYSETLVISEKGTKDYTVYCQDKTDTSVIIKKTVKNLTIEESTTSITVGDYSSNKIAASEDVAYYTNEAKEIIIKSTKNDPGVSKIEYATSDEMYYSISDIEGAVVDENMKWKPYNDTGRPTIPQNKAFYVYARITYTDGSYEYISTAKIIHDTTPPEITSAILTAKEKEDSDDNILVVLGKDSLIGIDTFYMLYEEKTEDSKIPKAKDVVKDGKGSGVETRNKEDAGASYTLSDLDTDKTYIFHIVAVDKLGNLSEVKTIESKGKAKSASSSSDNSSSEQASKLQPAPNGIAGSGDAKPPKTGTTGIPQKTQDSETKSPLDREINRTPYISDATGDTKIGLAATGGWDKINNEVKNADAGGSIDVEMSGFSVVPDKIFKTLMGKDLKVKFLSPEEVEWIVNGKDIETAKNSDIDMGVRIGARNIPTDMLDAITGVYPHTEIELKHDGEFGFSGILRIPLGKSNAGLYAYLYYYNTKTKEMELIQSTQITSTGYAEFSLVHASDYSIVIRSEEMLTTGSDKNNTALALTQASENKNAHSVLRLTDFAGSRASVRMWLFLIAIISAVMCGLILYMPGLKTEDSVE
ncbi:MAG: hypothetical protein ILN61_00840, partial [Lachnospiraceae bacterium]|nr:hypothetical protein [Lachnospiraceae bacterium]